MKPAAGPASVWSSFRLQFPVTAEHIYLNHAAVSPLPCRCQTLMLQYLDQLSRHGAAHYPGVVVEALGRARALGARLMQTRPERIFIVRSTTQGIGVAATGLPARAGDNVVLVEREFPANVRPWLPLRRRGVELRFVPQRGGRVSMDDLARAVDRRTAAVSISFVQFLSGFRADLSVVAELCRRSDALFVVDAIQGLGVFPLPVEALDIDVVAADSHKWLLGPEGVGLGYISPRALDRIEPALEGWLAVQEPFDFFDLDQPLKDSAARFEEGALNLAGIHGMIGSLELILDIGVDALSSRVLHLTDLLASGLSARGWTVLSPRETEAEKSGIVLATRDGLRPGRLLRRLDAAGVVVSFRDGALRISPHGYNSEDELEAFFAALDEASGG